MKILVFSFGGGTHDVTMMDFGKGVFQVLSTSGDTQMGGTDVDNAVLKRLLSKKGILDHIQKRISKTICETGIQNGLITGPKRGEINTRNELEGKLSGWWLVTASFVNIKDLTVLTYHGFGPGITVDDLYDHVNFVKEGRWNLRRLLRDELWPSDRLVWEQGKTIEEILNPKVEVPKKHRSIVKWLGSVDI